MELKRDERLTRVREMLGLRRIPIKIAFLDQPPAGVTRWTEGPVPAGCTFWDRAMEGKTFYTLAADHWNCAIGSHVHRIALPPDRAGELNDTAAFMQETRYFDRGEIAALPSLERPPAAVAYAPANSDAFRADVVLVAATPAQSTLIFEAALKAGVTQGGAGTISRPSCATLPVTARTQMFALSFGCRGNRSFTALGEDELYLSIPAARWDDVLDRIIEVQRSNLTVGDYYQAQRAKFAGKGD